MMLKNVSQTTFYNLIVNYGLVLGVLGGVCLWGSFPLFYIHFNQTALEYQQLVSITLLPWSCKALVGAISDKYPILGWHKRWYLIFSNILLFISMIGVATSFDARNAAAWLVFSSFSIMINNTLWEGQYANMVRFSKADTKGIPFSWSVYMVGLAIAAMIVGPSSHVIHIVYGIVAPLALIPLPWLIFYPSDTLPGDKKHMMTAPSLLHDDSQRIISPITKQDWVMSLWLALSSCLLIIVLLSIESFTSIVVAIFVSGLAASVAIYLLLRSYAGNDIFIGLCITSFASHLLWIDIDGPMDAFFTADSSCIWNGPNFDLVFYFTVVQLVSSMVGIGATVGNALTFWKYDVRTALLGAMVFRIGTGLFDLIMVQRWNIQVGISDKVVFLFGDAVFAEAARILVMLPIKMLASQILKSGKVTMSYSLIDSFQFLGLSISRIVGIILSKSLSVNARHSGECNFERLPQLVAFSHMVFPILTLSFIYMQIPRILLSK